MHYLLLLSYAVICQFDIAVTQNCKASPPNFPKNIDLTQNDFANFVRTVFVKNLWTAFPRTPSDVVVLVNWAKENNYKIRPCGSTHSWSPITVDKTTNCNNTLLVDVMTHLRNISVYPKEIKNYNFPVVRVQAGATSEELLIHLQSHNLGITTVPAIGSVSVAGFFATGSHGFRLPVAASLKSRKGYSLAVDRIVKVDAVTWDAKKNVYSLRTYDRSEYEMSALMIHLGQAFITAFILRVEENFNLSCTIRSGIPNTQLFADPELGPQMNSLSSLIESTGRVLMYTNPFMNTSLILQCREVVSCPEDSKLIAEPYSWWQQDSNYNNWVNEIFSLYPLENLPSTSASPSFPSADSHTYCGLSKNLLLYSRITEDMAMENEQLSYALLVKRENIQKAMNAVQSKFQQILESHRSQGKYPLVGFLDFRETGLDVPSDIGPSARSSFLAANSKSILHPELDTALWLEFLTIRVSGSAPFYIEMESYLHNTFNGSLGLCRPHWAKSWGYTEQGHYTNKTLMNDIIPSKFDYWDEFICAINKMDPFNIFTNNFIDQLFVATPSYTCEKDTRIHY